MKPGTWHTSIGGNDRVPFVYLKANLKLFGYSMTGSDTPFNQEDGA